MFKIENKELDFKRVSVRDALSIKNNMMLLIDASANADAKKAANDAVDAMAIKYLIIRDDKGQILENLTLDLLENLFQNPFAVVEISAEFQKVIMGFLSALPSYHGKK